MSTPPAAAPTTSEYSPPTATSPSLTSPPKKRQKTVPEQQQGSSIIIPSIVETITNPVPTTTTAVSTSTMASTTTASSIALQVKKLATSAKLPTRGSAFAAGYDLYASRETTVPGRGKVLVDTDISIACPAGTYGRIAPRSGLASKHFIDTGAGVIDCDYRGPVKVLLFNHADADFLVAEGDRVAQLVLERIITPDVVEVDELAETVRGVGGFGSTGTN